MPCCESAAIPKTSRLGSFFFAHSRKGDCITAPESPEHIYMKSLIAQAALSAGWSVITEQSGESPDGGKWTADVFCKKGGAQVAFEVQLSRQSVETTLARQKRYAASNVRCLWLLSSKTFPESYLNPSKETPCFYLSNIEIGEIPTVQGINVNIVEFTRGALSGNLKWKIHETSIQYQSYLIDYFLDSCWKCHQPIKQIYGYSIDVYGDCAKTIPNASTILEEIHKLIPNETLRIAGLNAIGKFDMLNGKVVNFPYCNTCIHCGAPQNNFYLIKKLSEHQRTDRTGSEEVLIESKPTKYKTGEWIFIKSPPK